MNYVKKWNVENEANYHLMIKERDQQLLWGFGPYWNINFAEKDVLDRPKKHVFCVKNIARIANAVQVTIWL